MGFSEATFDIDKSVAAPVLLLPAQGAAVGTLTPTFVWEPIVEPHGPVTYILLVEVPGVGPVIDVEVTGGSFTAPTNLFQLAHSWSVTARDFPGNTAQSGVRQFTVDLSAPLVELLAPMDDEILTEDRPTFEWQASGTLAAEELGIQVFDPDRYDLHIALVGDFGNPIVTADLPHVGVPGAPQSYALPVVNALDDGQYLWSVRAKSEAVIGAFTSPPRPFIVDLVQPDTPLLLAPASGDRISDRTPTFDWTDVVDTSGATYRLQVTSGDISGGPYDVDRGRAPAKPVPGCGSPD